MLKGHAKLMRLVEIVGEVTGRKKLQKMVYIAKRMHVDFDERFEFHMFGPYSEELTVKVDEMCNLGLLEEHWESKGAIQVYKYALNDAGRDFLRFEDVNLGRGEELIRRMNEENSRFLELVSTMLYFEHLPFDEMVTKVFTLKSKQRYTEEEVQKGLAFIEELRLMMH